jgi:hypothetical protein
MANFDGGRDGHSTLCYPGVSLQLGPHACKPVADQVGRRIIPITPGSRGLIDEPHNFSAHLSEPVLRRNVEIVRAEVEQADREYRFRRSCENR